MGEELHRRAAAPSTPVNAKFDVEVVDWFKAKGRFYQSRMNAALHHYMEARRRVEWR